MNKHKIAEHLTELREKAGYTKRSLARELGCSYSCVCSWEYADRIPSDEMKKKICDLYGVPISIFFTDK